MSELNEYRMTFISRLNSESIANGTSLTESFINELSELLCGAEEIPEDIHYCYYEGYGSDRKKKIIINGYTYNDFDNCLNLYIMPNTNINEFAVLTKEEIERCFRSCKNFILESDFIRMTAEESHPAYGLAADISRRSFEGLKKYQLFIVSDRLKTKNYESPEVEVIDDIPVEFYIIDIERIYQLENSLNGKVPLEINLLEFTDGKGIPCMLANKTEDYQSFLCNMPGLILANLYNTYGSRLLEGNVRSFLQQKNKVNKGIRATILKEPENFFVYNNGITATADEVSFDEQGNMVHVKGLQIVNGGQTTASLAACLLNDKKEGAEKQIASISVPMKLTAVPYDKAVSLIPNIARFANSQNAVKEADLWSNHPFHIKMEEISRRLITPIVNGSHGTYWYYERARGQYKQATYKKTKAEKDKFEKMNPKSQLLTKTDFSKYINIMELHPEFACLGGEKSFFKVATKIKDDWDKSSLEFNESYFQEIVSVALMYKDVDLIVKKQGREYKAQINAYSVSFLLYLVAQQYPKYHINYKELWAKQQVGDLLHSTLISITDIVYSVLVSDSRPVENVTEWAKRETCWNRIKNCTYELSQDFINVLLSKNEYDECKRDAKKENREFTSAQAMMEVYKIGSLKWQELLDWDCERKVLSEKERSIVSTATKMQQGKFPSEKQCLAILKALDRARDNGYLG